MAKLTGYLREVNLRIEKLGRDLASKQVGDYEDGLPVLFESCYCRGSPYDRSAATSDSTTTIVSFAQDTYFVRIEDRELWPGVHS